MYPISMGFDEVNKRLDLLVQNGHHSEAMLASVFCAEKSIRRSLRFCLLCRGLSSKQSDTLMQGRGLDSLKSLWPTFSKDYKSLPEFMGQDNWTNLKRAAQKRNKVVHGASVFKLAECQVATIEVRRAVEDIRSASISELGCDPWSTLPRRIKSQLVWNSMKQPVSKSVYLVTSNR